MTTDERMNEIFGRIGNDFGYDRTTAEFMAFKDFKVRWQRSYKWTEFKVSDYLNDAPDEVIEDLVRTLFSKLGGTYDQGYSKEMCDWVTRPEFSQIKRPIYLKRSRNILRNAKGDFRDLQDSMDRLSDIGLTENTDDVYISWSKEPVARKIRNSSVLMKVISISKHLDSEMVPDYVIDYCLYHELCHVIVGFDPTSEKHTSRYEELNSKFEKKEEAEKWIEKMCFYH
ncbi:MAG: hypothetical protein KRP56_03825 [Candidatus Methanogranum gryphiswaldense]|nr:MAG: hypothetical protein KRP56_03825 [Candidatus Methanogranum sp. U3.2.1]